jgi:hypothetical protein
MKIGKIVGGLLAVAMLGGPAGADVKQAAPDGIAIQVKAEVALDRDGAWARLLDLGSWWNGAHSYSGDADSMSIDAVAGGCWCELWSGGEVEHGRILFVMPKQAIRFSTALGPLQELGVTGAMTWTLSNGSAPGKTTITLDYKVTGSSLSALDKLAGPVDQVLTEQVTRFARGE